MAASISRFPLGQGGTLHVELNHSDRPCCPPASAPTPTTLAFLTCAANLAAEGKRVTLVSKDIPLRVRAAYAVGLTADEYHAQDVITSGWTGMAEVDVSAEEIDALFAEGEIDLEDARNMPCHTGIRLLGGSSHALGRVNADKKVQLVRGDREVFGCADAPPNSGWRSTCCSTSRWASSRWAARRAPAKSALALCAGLEAVLERRTQRKVVVFRPLYAVGGQELGYLPGSESDKMGPWAQAVFDTLEGLASPAVLEEVLSRGMLEVLPLTHIRGRSLHDSFVIVDGPVAGAQRAADRAVAARGGLAVVLTHDVAQRDNLRVGRHDGVAAVIENFQGPPTVRAHHPDAQRALADRRAGHRDARGDQPQRPAVTASPGRPARPGKLPWCPAVPSARPGAICAP